MFRKQRVEVVDFEKERKRAQRKESFKRKCREIKRWIHDNPELTSIILMVTPFMAKTAMSSVKAVAKNVRRRKIKDLKELYCYDRSLGHYWKLRRELTNDEWVRIDQRKRNGERLADILEEMKVLR